MPTQNIIIRCKCSTARATIIVTDRGTFVANDQNKLLDASWSNPAAWHCVGCKGRFKYEEIKGRATKHTCDARCLSSISGKCECACGGKNHGGAYA